MQLKGKIILVTGASSGIGEALVRELIKRECLVIGCARSLDKLTALQNELGSSFIPAACDVSNIDDVKKTRDILLEKNLCPSAFFLNAGIAGEECVEDPKYFSLEKHAKVMAVNYFGALAFVECFEKACQEKGGAHFIVTSSVNAIFAPPTGSAYAASKAAISKAFEGLSITYFETNLKFSHILTGPVRTNGLKGKWPFVWGPSKMACYMADFMIKDKQCGIPSVFYYVVAHLLRLLPYQWTMKVLKRA
jgi:short-subunit dehydrogenase